MDPLPIQISEVVYEIPKGAASGMHVPARIIADAGADGPDRSATRACAS